MNVMNVVVDEYESNYGNFVHLNMKRFDLCLHHQPAKYWRILVGCRLPYFINKI